MCPDFRVDMYRYILVTHNIFLNFTTTIIILVLYRLERKILHRRLKVLIIFPTILFDALFIDMQDFRLNKLIF